MLGSGSVTSPQSWHCKVAQLKCVWCVLCVESILVNAHGHVSHVATPQLLSLCRTHVHTSAIKYNTKPLLEARITIASALEKLKVSKSLEASLNEGKMDVTQLLTFTMRRVPQTLTQIILFYHTCGYFRFDYPVS